MAEVGVGLGEQATSIFPGIADRGDGDRRVGRMTRIERVFQIEIIGAQFRLHFAGRCKSGRGGGAGDQGVFGSTGPSLVEDHLGGRIVCKDPIIKQGSVGEVIRHIADVGGLGRKILQDHIGPRLGSDHGPGGGIVLVELVVFATHSTHHGRRGWLSAGDGEAVEDDRHTCRSARREREAVADEKDLVLGARWQANGKQRESCECPKRRRRDQGHGSGIRFFGDSRKKLLARNGKS